MFERGEETSKWIMSEEAAPSALAAGILNFLILTEGKFTPKLMVVMSRQKTSKLVSI